MTQESINKIGKSRFKLFSNRKEQIKRSFSGHERNHLFLNKNGQFADLSGVSGLDNPADSRVFVIWDIDRDGWPDLAVINSNRPVLNLYRNQIREDSDSQNKFIAVRFVGGNRSSKPNKSLSSRDAFGARVSVKAGSLSLIREHRCGEGLASQNSKTMLVGVGENDEVQQLSVKWPSGKQTQFKGDAPTGMLITFYEDPSQSPDGKGYSISPYQEGPSTPKDAQ